MIRPRHLLHLALILIGLSGCAKEAELTAKDREYVLMPEDIAGFDAGAYGSKTYKNGKTYIFLVSQSSMNGLTAGYRRTLITREGREIVFTTQVNVQSTEDRARELFAGSHQISSVIGKEHIVDLDPRTYGADELFLLISKDQYYMSLRKAKLVYILNMEGMAPAESQVRQGLQKKFAAASRIE